MCWHVGPPTQVWSAHDLMSLQLTEAGSMLPENAAAAGTALASLRARLPPLLLAAEHAWHVAVLTGATSSVLSRSALSSGLAPAQASSGTGEPYQTLGASGMRRRQGRHCMRRYRIVL